MGVLCLLTHLEKKTGYNIKKYFKLESNIAYKASYFYNPVAFVFCLCSDFA